METRSSRRRLGVWIVLPLAVIGTLVPVIRMGWFVFGTGEPILNYDYGFTIPIVDAVLSGTYDWRQFFGDSFFSDTHPHVYSYLLQMLDAALVNWSTRLEFGVGFSLAVIRLLLVYRLITRTTQAPIKWLMLPLLSALVFSPTQTALYEFGWNIMAWNLYTSGFVIGLWGLIEFRERPRLALGIAGFSGTLSALSLGSGAGVWLVFMVMMLVVGYRGWWGYVVMGALMLLTLSQPIYFRVIAPPDAPSAFPLLGVNPIPAVNMLGQIAAPSLQPGAYPFGTEALHPLGVMVLVLLVITVGVVGVLVARRAMMVDSTLYTAGGLLLFGLGTTAAIFAFRPQSYPRFGVIAALYWLALIALAYALARSGQRTGRLWATAVFGTLIPLVLVGSLEMGNKSSYTDRKTPTAAACYLNAQLSDETCLWHLGGDPFFTHASFGSQAAALESHGLSVFHSPRRYTLQGDFLFPSVRLMGTRAYWVEPGTTQPASYLTPQRLDLYLPAGSRVTWTAALPQDGEALTFRTRLIPDPSANITWTVEASDGASIASDTRAIDAATPITLDLTEHSGTVITVSLANTSGAAIAQAPHISARIADGGLGGLPPLAAADLRPAFSEADRVLFAGDDDWDKWQIDNLTTAPAGMIETDPDALGTLETAEPLDLCPREYRYLSFTLSVENYDRADDNIRLSRAMVLTFAFADGETRREIILLDRQNSARRYDYDLKRFEAAWDTRLSTLTLQPIMPGERARQLRLHDVRFVADPDGQPCAAD